MSKEACFEDAFNMLCGHEIGSGMTRKVFECNVRPDVVVKVEGDEVHSHFQNLQEWMVWHRVCGTVYEKWFAPVIAISPNGRILLMQRTLPSSTVGLPDKVPAFFTDFKRSNYGFIGERFVCHDYGSHLLMERGMTRAMKTVNWSKVDSTS